MFLFINFFKGLADFLNKALIGLEQGDGFLFYGRYNLSSPVGIGYIVYYEPFNPVKYVLFKE